MTGGKVLNAADIVRALQSEITAGLRKPGERLDERSLAEKFGVSRTPVREALKSLSATGLVTLRGRQGACVVRLSLPDLLDAFYVIAELEGMAARQAARRMRPDQRQRLEKTHLTCAVRAEAGDHEGFYRENLLFHEIISEGSQNRVLQEQIQAVAGLTATYRRFVTYRPGRMLSSIPEHEAITRAILRGDGEAACQLMRQHVNLLGEGLSDLLRYFEENPAQSAGILNEQAAERRPVPAGPA
jgi:DNA-binding GntR family transcriptional regulator